MARRATASLATLPLLVLLLASCGFSETEPGPRLAFTRAVLTHRGEHLVLDVAAVLLPDSTPANIACTGAVAASGVGVARDSVPVVHRDAAQGFFASCWAELQGSFANATATYTLYGPSLMGTWVGRNTFAGLKLRFVLLSPTVPCENPWVIEDTDYGARASGSCVTLEAGTPDSFRLRGHDATAGQDAWSLEASRSAFTVSEYRSLRGMVWASRLRALTGHALYLVERN